MSSKTNSLLHSMFSCMGKSGASPEECIRVCEAIIWVMNNYIVFGGSCMKHRAGRTH